MIEPLDLDALERDCARLWDGWPDWPIPVRALIEELRETRAERDEMLVEIEHDDRAFHDMKVRAERAEAAIARAWDEGYGAGVYDHAEEISLNDPAFRACRENPYRAALRGDA